MTYAGRCSPPAATAPHRVALATGHRDSPLEKHTEAALAGTDRLSLRAALAEARHRFPLGARWLPVARRRFPGLRSSRTQGPSPLTLTRRLRE
jgi:hypothetical protein